MNDELQHLLTRNICLNNSRSYYKQIKLQTCSTFRNIIQKCICPAKCHTSDTNKNTSIFNSIEKLCSVLSKINQCCSQGQNPNAKDEAKARTLKAKADVKAWTFEAKTKAWTLQGQDRGRGLDPRDQDQGQLSSRPISRPNMTHNLMPIYHTPLT